MHKVFCCRLIFTLVLAIGTAHSTEQAAGGYDAVIQQGKSQLQAGSAEQATASGKAAIKMSTERWEGYALVGGALMNLKRYEAAADTLSDAIKRAPESKQASLRELRRQCLLAESGSSAAPNPSMSATTTSQAEIVLWKSIENSPYPADFQAYLSEYPRGAFSSLAEQRLATSKAQAERAMQLEREQIAGEYMWTDPSSGLTWIKLDGGVMLNDHLFKPHSWDAKFPSAHVDSFAVANRYCAELKLLGYTDWRLPTAAELLKVYHTGHRLGGLFGDNMFLSFSYTGLWTSSTGTKDDEHIAVRFGIPQSIADTTSEIGGFWHGTAHMAAICVRQ